MKWSKNQSFGALFVWANNSQWDKRFVQIDKNATNFKNISHKRHRNILGHQPNVRVWWDKRVSLLSLCKVQEIWSPTWGNRIFVNWHRTNMVIYLRKGVRFPSLLCAKSFKSNAHQQDKKKTSVKKRKVFSQSFFRSQPFLAPHEVTNDFKYGKYLVQVDKLPLVLIFIVPSLKYIKRSQATSKKMFVKRWSLFVMSVVHSGSLKPDTVWVMTYNMSNIVSKFIFFLISHASSGKKPKKKWKRNQKFGFDRTESAR